MPEVRRLFSLLCSSIQHDKYGTQEVTVDPDTKAKPTPQKKSLFVQTTNNSGDPAGPWKCGRCGTTQVPEYFGFLCANGSPSRQRSVQCVEMTVQNSWKLSRSCRKSNRRVLPSRTFSPLKTVCCNNFEGKTLTIGSVLGVELIISEVYHFCFLLRSLVLMFR